MKFYESHYEEYLESMKNYNLHPELSNIIDNFPKKISQIGNIILYGPSGVGKYSQALSIIRKYSSTDLKYDKKITIQTEKQNYTYHISDIHYEIDMSLLGCNSKILWHELFLQIVDIISIKHEKVGFIVCKNFHMIHAELLEIFYSYIQQYSISHSSIQIHFIIITEHISFLPNNIINACQVINVRRPAKDQYLHMSSTNKSQIQNNILPISLFNDCEETQSPILKQFMNKISNNNQNQNIETISKIQNSVDVNGILNCKEIRSFSMIKNGDFPKDLFNTICDTLIDNIINHDKLSFTGFRDSIYDMLIYNLDITDCICYILYYFIEKNSLTQKDVSDILNKTYTFLKYYNNNYRPIYHLESILFTFITKIHKYE